MLDDLQNPLFLKWTGVSSGFGAVLSFLVALISGAGFPAILYRPFLYGIIMGVVAAGSFFVIKLLIPELFDQLNEERPDDTTEKPETETDDSDQSSKDDTLEDSLGEEKSNEKEKTGESSLIDEKLELGNYGAQQSVPEKKKKEDKVTEDEVIVQGVSLKNEPKLMADAIRDLIERDE